MSIVESSQSRYILHRESLIGKDQVIKYDNLQQVATEILQYYYSRVFAVL